MHNLSRVTFFFSGSFLFARIMRVGDSKSHHKPESADKTEQCVELSGEEHKRDGEHNIIGDNL